MKNNFYSRLNGKSDEEILSIYRQRYKYVQEAQEAMTYILETRDLYEQALEQDEQDENEAERVQKETIVNFENEVLGSSLSNIEFAEKSLNGEVYFKSIVAVWQKKYFFSDFALILGFLGVISFFLFLITNEYKRDLVLYWAIPSILFSLFLIVGIKGLKSAK